jgi:hypothetical protein
VLQCEVLMRNLRKERQHLEKNQVICCDTKGLCGLIELMEA